MPCLHLNPRRSSMMVCIVVLMLCSRLSAEPQLRVSGETMGTYFMVTIDSPPASDTNASVRAEILETLSTIIAQMSTWEPESEISRFNRSNSTDWFPVSAEFAAVVEEAHRVHQLTGGAFDPTVSPLIDLWGFGRREPDSVPDDAAISEALQSVGMQHLSVRSDPPALRRSRPDVQLNLSAIAKGYAVDAIAEMLTRSGRPSYIVDIGGEVRAGVAKASGAPWKIGIESPQSTRGSNASPARIVPITESSVATSGDYRNFYEVDGKVYSHTIDPVSGRPLENPPASVSVRHHSCMTADALATAMMVLGRDRGMQLATAQDHSVLFQIVAADGAVTEHGTGTFAAESTESGDASESWIVFVAAGALFLIAVGGMAIGILISNRRIQGSCGGLASLPGSDGKSVCELCSIPRNECVNEELRQQIAASGSERTREPANPSPGS